MRYALLLAVAALAAHAQQKPQPLYTIPFTTHAGGVYLGVRVNGSKPLQFLLDTAAGVHLVNAARAPEAGLGEPVALSRATGAGDGATTASLYDNISLAIGGLTLEVDRIAAIDLTRVEERKGFAIDGLLGAPFLRQFVVEIDTGTSTMKLYDPETWTYAGTGEAIPARFDARGQPHIRLSLVTPDGETLEGEYKIDSAAAEATIMLTGPFAAKHEILARLRRSGKRLLPDELFGVGGGSRMWTGRVAAIRLGSTTFSNVVIDITEAKGGTLASTDIAGIVGGQLLHRFRVIYDYKRSRIYLEPTDRLTQPLEQEMAGIRWFASGKDHREFSIRAVLPGSPALAAGLRPGDVLVSVDGTPANSFDKWSLRRHLTSAGDTVKMRLRRNGQHLDVRLTLSPLI